MADLRYGTTIGGQTIFHAGNTKQLLEVFNYKKPELDLSKLNLTGGDTIGGSTSNIPKAPLYISQGGMTLGIDSNEVICSTSLILGTGDIESNVDIRVGSGRSIATFYKEDIQLRTRVGIATRAISTLELAIGDSDTGFNWVSDGRLQSYANGQAIDEATNNGRKFLKDIHLENNSINNVNTMLINSTLTMNGGSTVMRMPTVGTWARGIEFKTPGNISTNQYGLGVYGSASTSNYFYIGAGSSPWSSYAMKLSVGSRIVDFYTAPRINGRTTTDLYQPKSDKLTVFDSSLWSTNSGQDLLCRGKRALVGFESTADGLVINYANDFGRARVDSELAVVGDLKVQSYLTRNSHRKGCMVGSYNSVAPNADFTNPIYTIGSNYLPTDSELSNMYGIGYSSATTASFLTGAKTAGATGWGMYVAADGDARIFLSASDGEIWASSNIIAEGGFVARGPAGSACISSNDVSKWVFTIGSNHGIYWDTSSNQYQFRYSNSSKFSIDVDNGNLTTVGALFINNAEPYICLQDTTHRSAFMFYNVDMFELKRGSANNSTTWESSTAPFRVNMSNGHIYARGSVYENGSPLSDRYLGKTAKAADSEKLDGIDSSDLRGGIRLESVDITVGGESNKYYPVLISASSTGGYAWSHINIARAYNWTGPNDWNNSTHRGGLTFCIEQAGDGNWGGNDKNIRVAEFSESYSTMVGGLALSTAGLIVWLRGGGGKYRITTKDGVKASCTVHLNGYTDSRPATYAVRTYSSSIIDSEIYSRYYVRGTGQLYDSGHRVYSPVNKPSASDLGLSGEFLTYNYDGSSEYATIVPPKSTWVRTPDAGILPYTNGTASLGTSSWKFANVHSVRFYENGTELSSKYLPRSEASSLITVTNSTSSAWYPVVWHNNSNRLYDTVGRFEFHPGSGHLKITGSMYAQAYFYNSDRNLKEGIVDIEAEDAWNFINSFRSREYFWKDSGIKSRGFIAQEVREKNPEMVSSNGNNLTVNYNEVVAPVVRALQDAHLMIKDLQDKVMELTERLNSAGV